MTTTIWKNPNNLLPNILNRAALERIAYDVFKDVNPWGLVFEHIKEGLEYLDKYGYINLDGKIELQEVLAAIRLFQEVAGLNNDGELGPKTFRAMKWPRCALPDRFMEVDENDLPRIAEARWGRKNLTYYIAGRDSDLSVQQWDAAIEKAFEQWSYVADLRFSRTNSSSGANFILSVGSGRRDNFDGQGGTLAWHYLPPRDGYQGQLQGKFDAAETWVVDSGKRGIYLLNVACHEIGHGLGLEHSKVQSALMAPFYSPNVTKPQRNDDITRIQRLYGPPTNGGGGGDGGGNGDSLPAPSQLKAEWKEGTRDVLLTWKDNSTGEDRFEVFRNGQSQGSVGRGHTRAVDGQVPDGRHKYVVVVHKGVDTAKSNTAIVTVGNDPEPPPKPPEERLEIIVQGRIDDVKIPGYRVSKIG